MQAVDIHSAHSYRNKEYPIQKTGCESFSKVTVKAVVGVF